MSRTDDLARIGEALRRAADVLQRFSPGEIEHRLKSEGDPVTEADEAVDAALRCTLPQPGEGWLSEETVDDPARLGCARTWIVDPLDGTKEFVQGIPEWCVSVGLVEGAQPVAGGILIPTRELTILGSLETGVTVNGEPATVRQLDRLDGVRVLASRSEVKRGQWERFGGAPFAVEPMGSVACKMGLVAAGLADATWTLVPKNEWDVAGGTALVRAAGGAVWRPDGEALKFNQRNTLLPGLLATPAGLEQPLREYLA
ncbi:MAG: 3'(2'),5'-bisphosphate nucleotidase CysQ [Acidobacteria bacterium]|nr:3'(2'),5'-bisphosphate nucleotidase CysQ [Acidobacteriota bacterium]NIM61487.1 3'(2'),5'-bisphosphate nucleotidase CysQ [Acidobacteriota bacterium]NIO58119.1 3'(2'),5'-bisphosphate nucleotidase CysQ [Acidobacteriota bacterium]NIQ29131.1 3'(2'),5'-bisphosphate nucleotidase CysQ [Acidobacteriota bacterium]NIQ83682.1 3'(2'),5'-bisphosphate nucleotidase CysQ [Acidobacteriota bacterium]